jgi:hypothetical protein
VRGVRAPHSSSTVCRPAGTVALALVGALEGVVIALAGQAPHDEQLAARTAAGVLGLDSPPDRDTPWFGAPGQPK